MSILSYTQPSLMTVKASDLRPLVHERPNSQSMLLCDAEAIQLHTRLIGRKKKTVFNLVNLPSKVNLFKLVLTILKYNYVCPSIHCARSSFIGHRLVNIMAYINQLEGISNLREICSDNIVGKAKYCRIILVKIFLLTLR